MSKRWLFPVIMFAALLFLSGCAIFNQQNDRPTDDPPTNDPPSNEPSNGDNSSTQIVWGVDSASYTTNNRIQCVKENFGKPQIWGRYLGTNEGTSVGIDREEVLRLHESNIHLLVIYNHATEPVGYDNGVSKAEDAITMAENLDMPNGVAIFLDVEPSYPVDSAFIQGWYDTLASSSYEAGIYGVFDPGSDVLNAFNATNQEAQENIVVWSAYPQENITTKANAPNYNPHGPEGSLLYGWQYAIESDQCNIDTNLFQVEIEQYIW